MKCRLCFNKLKKPFLSLGCFPLANSFIKKKDIFTKPEIAYPLDVYICSQCYLVQLEEFKATSEIFSASYAYYSSYSSYWLNHCREYTKMVIDRFGFNKNSFIIEIGSNDGYLLQFFKKYNIPVLGIEPAKNTAKVAIEKGIPTKMVFFNHDYAKKIAKRNKKADLIIGNNVLAHNPNLRGFIKGMKIALKPKGAITMEFPHLLNLIEKNQFDTIYHEHFSYLSLHSTIKLFRLFDLEIFDVNEIITHGGSLRIYGKHAQDKSKPINKRVASLLKKRKNRRFIAARNLQQL